MRFKAIMLAALGGFVTTGAWAQAIGWQTWVPNLSGYYRCVQNCGGGRTVHVVQIGRELTVTGPAGETASAWIGAPGHIRTSWNVSGVYSPSGFTIQFDNG